MVILKGREWHYRAAVLLQEIIAVEEDKTSACRTVYDTY